MLEKRCELADKECFMYLQSNLGPWNSDGSNWFESPINFPYIPK